MKNSAWNLSAAILAAALILTSASCGNLPAAQRSKDIGIDNAVVVPAVLAGYSGSSGIHTDYGDQAPLQGLVSGRYYKKIAADPDAYFNRLASMGVAWLRIEFEEFMGSNAAVLESQIGMYQVIVSGAHKRGIKILGLVGTNAMPDRTGFPKTNQQIYVDALKWHLETYQLDAVEICNEPMGFLGGSNDPSVLPGYAKAMIESYVQLKPLYPDVLFVAPVTANAEAGEWLGLDWQSGTIPDPENSIFNNAAMQAYRDGHEGKLPLDVISWHPYGTGGDPEGNFYFGRDYATYYSEIMAYKDIKGRPVIGDYPIWFTEYGWSSFKITEAKQADYYDKLRTAMAKTPQIKAAFWYTYQDDETDDPGTENNTHGLTCNKTQSFRTKPVYFDFLSKTTGVGLYETGKSTNAYSKFIIAEYESQGGAGTLGDARGFAAVEKNGFSWQIFEDKNKKLSAIIQDGSRAFLVCDEIFTYYFGDGSSLEDSAVSEAGFPVNRRMTDGRTVFMDTQKGTVAILDGTARFFPARNPELLRPSEDSFAGKFDLGGSIREVVPIRLKVEFLGAQTIGSAGQYAVKTSAGYWQEFQGGSMGDVVVFSQRLNGDISYVLDKPIFDFIISEGGEEALAGILGDVYEVSGRKYVKTKKGIVIFYGNEVKWF